MNSDETGLTKSNLCSYQFIFFIRICCISEEKYGNDEPVCQKWKSLKILVDRGDPEYSGPKNLAKFQESLH